MKGANAESFMLSTLQRWKFFHSFWENQNIQILLVLTGPDSVQSSPHDHKNKKYLLLLTISHNVTSSWIKVNGFCVEV